MDIAEIARQMKKVAEENPHDMQINPTCPESCMREFLLADQCVLLVFTLDVWPTEQRVWHLTVTPESDLPPSVMEEILQAFFGIPVAQLPVMESLSAMRGKLL